MSEVATQSVITEESAPISSRNKVKQRVAETVKNKLTQLNIDDADSLSNRITEMLAEGNSKEKLNEELTKLIGADKLKSSFVEWLYGYSNVFFPPTPALSEKDDGETEEKAESAKGGKKTKKGGEKETKTKRRASQSRRRSGSKSSVSSIDTDKSSKSNKKPLSPPASPAPAQDKQAKEKSKRRLSRSASSLDLANKVSSEVMAQAIAIAAAAESNNIKHTRERSGSISSNRSVERRNSFNRERRNSISSNSSNSERVRCQYWPECNRGDQCKFWHPKELCKKYPNCPNGDKCLYIHPAQPNRPQSSSYNTLQSKHNRTRSDASSVISTASDRSIVECKFGANCNRPDCKYSHPSPAAIAAQIAKKATAAAAETLEQTKQELQKHLQEQAQLKASVAAAKTSAKTNVPCHFFPNCKNPDCPYQHPSPSQAINNLKTKQSNSEFNVPCRYDGNCTRSDCKFIHTNRKNH